MVQLRGGTHYLLLLRADDGSHRLLCQERFHQAISKWEHTGTRISPLFALDGAGAPEFASGTTFWLFFCGPVHPGESVELTGVDRFVTLGLFNLLFVCSGDADRKRAVDFAAARDVGWEEWQVVGGKIADVKYHVPRTNRFPLKEIDLRPPYPKENDLCATSREYITLVAESICRANSYTPNVCRELLQFDRAFRGQLLKDDDPVAAKQGYLTTVNAALSRYTAQTYAGTSPIRESVSHYWTHSFLGIGTASLALVQIRRFIEKAVDETRLIQRLRRLREEPPVSGLLQGLPPTDDLWKRDLLFPEVTGGNPVDWGDSEAVGEPAASLFPQADDPSVPVLTYFSGRDGFRAGDDDLTLSAPLELMDSCNSIKWTLLTITHEISHILVDGVLGLLLPDPRKDSAVKRAVTSAAAPPANLLEQVKHLLVYGVWAMKSSGVSNDELSPRKLASVLLRDGRNVYELVTHCFDFIYFYKSNAEVYIQAVWVSWSAIPNLEDRISEYLVRCLSALYTQHLRREKAIDITIDQLLNLLKNAAGEFPKAQYVPIAIEELEKNREAYHARLGNCRSLVLFVRHFLYSPKIEQRLLGEDATLEFKATEFGEERVRNPIRFIHDFSRDAKPDHIRSAWVLQQLAFAGAV